VNVEVDDVDNSVTNDDDEDGSEDEDVIAESLCEPTKMLYILELMLAFHTWYKKGHPLFENTSRYEK